MSTINDASRFMGSDEEKRLIQIAYFVYVLQLLSLFTGVCLIIGVIINYIKCDDAYGTWLASHYKWQIRTFWWTILWTALGIATFWFLIGSAILAIAGLWFLYRIIKGWLRLYERKPMYLSDDVKNEYDPKA